MLLLGGEVERAAGEVERVLGGLTTTESFAEAAAETVEVKDV